jgi:hypothetical protein
MSVEQNIHPITSFLFEGKEQPVSFIETIQVGDGEFCDVYAFFGDKTKDLGIIRIKPGGKTPVQKVMKGDRTIEGYVSGKGKLTITKPDDSKKIYPANSEAFDPVTVAIGEIMQWEADSDSELVAYEICFPPYEDGRYINLD